MSGMCSPGLRGRVVMVERLGRRERRRAVGVVSLLWCFPVYVWLKGGGRGEEVKLTQHSPVTTSVAESFVGMAPLGVLVVDVVLHVPIVCCRYHYALLILHLLPRPFIPVLVHARRLAHQRERAHLGGESGLDKK